MWEKTLVSEKEVKENLKVKEAKLNAEIYDIKRRGHNAVE
jgi:hypothetical protein